MNAKSNTQKVDSTTARRMTAAGRIIIILLLVALAGCSGAQSSVLTHELFEPLNGVSAASIEIDPGDGNLTIDPLIGSQQELASGTLQYLENNDQPIHTVDTTSTPAVLTLKGSGGQATIQLPWQACNGATDWQIHLNPAVTAAINAHTGGGNVTLNLGGMLITHLLADTAGGNVDVVLPDLAANLNATLKTGGGNVTIEAGGSFTGSSTISASSGAGNVVVRLPDGVAARIHATSGMGETVVDSRFSKVDDTTYQSANYDSATDKVDITIETGAGNVTVEENS